jgi:hypothetical protein
VAVETVGVVGVAVAGSLWGRGHDGHAAALGRHGGRKACPALHFNAG